MLTLAHIGCIATPKPVGYATTVEGLPGGPPLAYWRLGEPGGTTIHDRRPGNRHGAYAGSVAYGAPTLPQDSDGAIDFAGTGRGDIGHDAGLLLSALTVSLWFKLHTIPPDAEPAQTYVLFSKDISGLNQGDFSIAVFDTGNLEVTFQTTSTVHKVIIPNIETNAPHHVVVRADSTGFDAYVNGQFIEKVDNYTGAWTSNVNPIGLARAPWSPVDANGVIDEVAIYPRVVTEAEVLALAQQDLLGQTPVAATDILVVPENAVTTIDVTANDTFVGQKTNLTIEIMSQPAGGDSVAVNGNNDVDYTAGEVDGNTLRGFTYRITDSNGQSNTATVQVTVQDTAAPPPSELATMCYVESDADTVQVGSAAALATAINNAPPGRNILIAPGTYSGDITFTAGGTEANPIVIRPRDGIGTVTFNDVSWSIQGTGLVISKLYFNQSRINYGNNNPCSFIRTTRCRFRQISRLANAIAAATDIRIDHCDFADYVSNDTVNKACVRLIHNNVGNGTCKRILVDHCYIHDITPSQGKNGCEPVGLNASSAGALFENPELVIDHCLFRNLQIPNEGEIIGAKCSGTVVRFTTFENCTAMYFNCPRQGAQWEVRSCWFEGGRNPTLQVMSDDPLIIGNRFVGGEHLDIFAGIATWEDTVALGQSGTSYHNSKNGRIIGNVLDTGQIRVGWYWNNGTPTVPAQNNELEANIRNGAPATTGNGVTLDFQTGTTISATTEEPFVPAVKLTPGDVGLLAADPLCGG